MTEKTEREDGDWRVLHSTRSVFYVRAMGYQVMPEDAKRITDDLWLLPDLS